jgi:hypothetical protein
VGARDHLAASVWIEGPSCGIAEEMQSKSVAPDARASDALIDQGVFADG